MNLLAISGRVRNDSYNPVLFDAMSALCPADFSVIIYEKIKSIPIFNPDIDDSDISASVNTLILKVVVVTSVSTATSGGIHSHSRWF